MDRPWFIDSRRLPNHPVNVETKAIIAHLGLEPLPDEGGYFRRTWTGSAISPNSQRPTTTAIYFLITSESFSALHRLDADETWHFYAGDPVCLVQLHVNDGMLSQTLLGNDFSKGQIPQSTVCAGDWQGASLHNTNRGWALVGCTMTPGWHDQSFTLGQRKLLLKEFPHASAEIQGLTR